MSIPGVSLMNSAVSFALTQAERGFNSVNQTCQATGEAIKNSTLKVANYAKENKNKICVILTVAAFVYNSPLTALLIGLACAKAYRVYQNFMNPAPVLIAAPVAAPVGRVAPPAPIVF